MSHIKAACLLLLAILLAGSVQAQEGDPEDWNAAVAYSSLNYDAATNTIIGYSETDLDGSLIGDYYPQVTGYLYKDGGLIQQRQVRGRDGDYYVSVTLETGGVTGSTYEMDGHHLQVADYFDYDLGHRIYYYDPFDFEYWSGLGEDALWSFPFTGQDQPRTLRSQNIPLGNTYDRQTLSGACRDERDTIIAEYHTAPHVTTLNPNCTDFVQSASTSHYNFSNYNSGTYSWAIVRATLTTGVESVVTNYGSAPVWSSGYRNPAREYYLDVTAVPPQSFTKGSHHMAGDAVDFHSDVNSWPLIKSASKAAGGCVEPLVKQGNSPLHVHVDWRGACPALW